MQLKWNRTEQNIQCRIVTPNWNGGWNLMVIFLNTLVTLQWNGMLNADAKLDYPWRRTKLILDSISTDSPMNGSVAFWHVWHFGAMLMNHQVNPWEQINANKETTQTDGRMNRWTDRRTEMILPYLSDRPEPFGTRENLEILVPYQDEGVQHLLICWLQSLGAVSALMFSRRKREDELLLGPPLSPLLVGWCLSFLHYRTHRQLTCP